MVHLCLPSSNPMHLLVLQHWCGWTDGERSEFVTWIANNPLAGDVISATGGLRKVCYSQQGMAKRRRLRDLLHLLDDGKIWLLIVCSTARFDNLPTTFLKQLTSTVTAKKDV